MSLLLLLAVGAFEFNGQATTSLSLSDSGRWFSRVAGEYRPQLRLALGAFDAEVSARGSAGVFWRLFDSTGRNLSLKPYRAFVRYGREHLEVRAGLQQLNFGAGTILRPLRWFDRIDPADPVQTTEGVYGLLGRGFLGNSSAWLWTLLGNRETKGAELTPTPQWSPEAGGRLELALPRGEAAASAHFRRTILPPADTAAEQRLGLDARCDIGIGLWTEGSVTRLAAPAGPVWQAQAMLGADYTLGVGNGLTLLAEHMAMQTEPAAGIARRQLPTAGWQPERKSQVSALSLSYPLGIADNLRGFGLFDWTSRRPYSYLAWQRTWNSWIVVAAGFWQPAGAGGQLTVVFNH